jgi:hypothetical protein
MEVISAELSTHPGLLLPTKKESLLIPIGDIQLDPKIRGHERQCDIDRLKRIINWGLERDAYFIGMGDYVDVASPSNRESLKTTRMYDNLRNMMEEAAYQTEDELRDLLVSTKGRWLGLLSGHHLWEYDTGQTTDTRLAEFLECPHLGTSTLSPVWLDLGEDSHKRRPMFRVFAHHGQGGGRLLSGPLNQLEHVLKAFDADVYLVGHHHKAVAAKYPLLSTIGGERGGVPQLVHKDRLLACTGSFLKGYTQGSRRGSIASGSYVEVGLMNPVSLGAIGIMIRPELSDGYASVNLDFISL